MTVGSFASNLEEAATYCRLRPTQPPTLHWTGLQSDGLVWLTVATAGLSNGFTDYLYLGLFVPWTVRTIGGLFVPWTFRTMDYSYHRRFVPWTIRTIPGLFVPFVPWTIRTVIGLFVPSTIRIVIRLLAWIPLKLHRKSEKHYTYTRPPLRCNIELCA